MLGLSLTFLLCAIVAAVFGFSGLAGTLTTLAQLFALLFVALFVLMLIYSTFTEKRISPPI